VELGVEAARARPVLKVHGVAKRFSNGTLAVTGVDLDLHAGEFMSLLGPSGCGKSTLLRMIAGPASPALAASNGRPPTTIRTVSRCATSALSSRKPP